MMSPTKALANAEYEQQVLEYFRLKAEDYDLVDQQVYWNLSDKLLWNVLEEQVLQHQQPNFNFIDAGGGTGRWTAQILKSYSSSQGVLFDLSEDMSKKAIEKAINEGFQDRLKVQNGNLEQIATVLPKETFDLIFNFHNVLGFVQNVETAVSQMVSLLKSNGLFVSFLPNQYHTIFFNIFVGNTTDAEYAVGQGRGRFTTDMPYINLFTPDGTRKLYEENGLEILLLTGFPNLIYPGMQETQLQGSSISLEKILNNPSTFERIYQIEKDLLYNPDIAARGNNLFIIGKKH